MKNWQGPGKVFAALICFGLLSLALASETDPDRRVEPAAPPGLAALEFIAGNWVGKMGDGDIQEVWTAPNGDNMIGMFRLTQAGKAAFYELQSIELTPEGPRLNLRHFNPGLSGWEEKDEALRLPLSELEPGRAIFGESGGETRLEYRRVAEDRLEITLHKLAEGKKSASTFHFRLLNAAAE